MTQREVNANRGNPEGRIPQAEISRQEDTRSPIFLSRELVAVQLSSTGLGNLRTTGQSADWIRENEARLCRLVPMKVFACRGAGTGRTRPVQIQRAGRRIQLIF